MNVSVLKMPKLSQAVRSPLISSRCGLMNIRVTVKLGFYWLGSKAQTIVSKLIPLFFKLFYDSYLYLLDVASLGKVDYAVMIMNVSLHKICPFPGIQQSLMLIITALLNAIIEWIVQDTVTLLLSKKEIGTSSIAT